MKIYYSPDFSGNVFLGLKEKSILFNTEVVDTMGLIGMIELRLGLTFSGLTTAERETAYYKAVSMYMEKHPDNILSRSFKLSGLEVSRSCLEWRDTLSLIGWNDKSPVPSERMEVLRGIEEYFDCPGFPERVNTVTNALREHIDIFKDDVFMLPCEIELLHPAVQTIFRLMSEGGAKITSLPTAKDGSTNLAKVRTMLISNGKDKISLDPEDRSFNILHFNTELEALSYLAYQDDKMYDAWINSDNKALDNWLKMMGKPTAGSSMNASVPQTAQLLILGIGLFYRPLNVNTLVQWLFSPIHPLDAQFRYSFAEIIASEGGFDNQACKDAIEKYIEGSEDKDEARRKIETFLPDLSAFTEGKIRRDELLRFTSELKIWASGYAHYLESSDGNALRIEQLNALVGNICSFQLLLENESDEFLSYELVETWSSTLYQAGAYSQYPAQAGSRFVIESPSKLAGIADKTIWCGFYNAPEFHSSVDFLSSEEIESFGLGGYADRENALSAKMQALAFTHTNSRIDFVVVDRRHDQPVEKHPLMIRFEKQISNIKDFISSPKFDKSLMVKMPSIDNMSHPEEYAIKHPELINWPTHISHTSMDLLVQHPLDYVMQNVADIQGSNVPAMADLKRTEGTVAHAVIQALFSPEEGKTKGPDEVDGVLDAQYDAVFSTQVEAHGAILNLRENKLECKQLKSELRQCVDNLLEIMRDNGCRVKWCEHKLREHINLLSGDDDPWVNGFIDMTLEDKTGSPIVFDFKWTTSKKYYPKLLSKNISSQLALYQHLLQIETGKPVLKTGYFLMPEGRLYSRESFVGDFCEQVETADFSNLVPKMKASFNYRRNQILSGIIENGDGMLVEMLQYGKDTESNGLFPLHQADDGTKEGNIFTNYSLFK